jgi:transposase
MDSPAQQGEPYGRGNQSVDLKELLAANAPLATIYILKDQMKELWFAPSTQVARERWNDWLRLALESAVAPLVQFANRLTPHAHGIIASARHRLNTSVLEGMNNKIKVIKRMAYGYRDSSYFFLKVKDAFPAKMR